MWTDASFLLLSRTSLAEHPNGCSKTRPRVEHVFGTRRRAADAAAAPRLAPTDAVTALGRDIRRLAEREPDLARRHAGGERLAGGAAAEPASTRSFTTTLP